VRVIAGTAKGVRLQTLEGEATRPTTERVKEALMSAVQFDIEGRQVLDLFAGSGQLGVEALSRGAASCVFVDRSSEAAAIIRKNAQATGVFGQSRVLCTDALDFLAHTKDRFDLVFLDPPYAADLLLPALQAVEPRLNTGAVVMAESDGEVVLPDRIGKLTLQKVYRYGRIFLRKYVEVSE